MNPIDTWVNVTLSFGVTLDYSDTWFEGDWYMSGSAKAALTFIVAGIPATWDPYLYFLGADSGVLKMGYYVT
jgi:hypothetical protein